MGIFLYTMCFALIFFCGFGLPFAVKTKPVAWIMFAASIVLFFGGLSLSELARQGPPLNFLAVLALSVLPFAAGALARVITLYLFADKDKEWIYVAGVGAVTTVLYLGIGFATFGLMA